MKLIFFLHFEISILVIITTMEEYTMDGSGLFFPKYCRPYLQFNLIKLCGNSRS
jgi:hypothetical protein